MISVIVISLTVVATSSKYYASTYAVSNLTKEYSHFYSSLDPIMFNVRDDKRELEDDNGIESTTYVGLLICLENCATNLVVRC